MRVNVSKHAYDIVNNQLGIDDPIAAVQYLASAKIPCSFYTSGTGEDANAKKMWVPMDPSFKKYKVTQTGVDFNTAMAFDWKSFSSDYLGTLQNITPLIRIEGSKVYK